MILTFDIDFNYNRYKKITFYINYNYNKYKKIIIDVKKLKLLIFNQ